MWECLQLTMLTICWPVGLSGLGLAMLVFEAVPEQLSLMCCYKHPA